jgi:hypothetical protein
MKREEYIELLRIYEAFLSEIPLDKYKEELRPIKTVEQDLPKELNPLYDLYYSYWTEEPTKSFPSFEDFFNSYWDNHERGPYILKFIEKYLWGCSHDFVKKGLKARLYRTFISVLTQFHFCYTWKAYCSSRVEASAELDMRGIDAKIFYDDYIQVGLQIKKETYRPEAREGGRFAQRSLKDIHLFLEIPYTINEPEDLEKKCQNAKKQETRKRYQKLYYLSRFLQKYLSNGFVVFEPSYAERIEKNIIMNLHPQSPNPRRYTWEMTLDAIIKWDESSPLNETANSV